jgi:uncharacterized protein DUF6273
MVKDEIISFGLYNWQVLHVGDDRALIITEDIIGLRWYHSKFADVTWADCDLRQYLNTEFYNEFSQDEKATISTITNSNANNQWFKTRGGENTIDSIFLLSLEEVCDYFGDSKRKLQIKGSQTWFIDDENNGKRQAKYGNEYHWWRLRSPGYYGRTGASVNYKGYVYVRGNGVYGSPRDGGGIRPALWLKLGKNGHRSLPE